MSFIVTPSIGLLVTVYHGTDTGTTDGAELLPQASPSVVVERGWQESRLSGASVFPPPRVDDVSLVGRDTVLLRDCRFAPAGPFALAF